MYYYQCKPKNSKWGRLKNEATNHRMCVREVLGQPVLEVTTYPCLHDRSCFRGDHSHRDIEQVAMVGERQGMVPSGCCDHSPLPLFLEGGGGSSSL